MKKISYILAFLLVATFSFNVDAATKWTTYRIMLDPGHGGTDPGASGPSAPHEATLALRCGKALQTRIVNECGGTVKMTRSTDVFISLSSRKSQSVSYDPYIFCSIHLNAFNGTAKGTETYYYWTTGNSSTLANKVQAQLIANFKTVSGFTPTNRGVKTAAYTVITGSSNVPAILTEGLFVDNSTEWSIINTESKDGFKKWVQGHLYGFHDRLELLNSDIIDPSSSGTTTTTPTWTVSPTEWTFTCVEGGSSTVDVTIKGSNLTAAPTATISGTGFSIASSSLTKTNSTVKVKFAPSSAGSYSGTLTLKSGTLSQTVKLTGTATVAPLTFTEKWNASDNAGTLTKFGWDAGKVRNMTYNAGKLYLVYNHSDIKVVNAQTGADLGNLNKGGVEGGTLTFCDVKYFDGKIVACNLAVTGQALKLYVWDDDQQNPRVLLNTTDFGSATRIGDCIGFYGTWSSGKVVFSQFTTEATRIVEYAITNGVCATTPTVVNATTDGTTVLNAGTSVRVYPDASGYWLDGKNNYTARLSTSGKQEYVINNADETWGNAFEIFTWKGTQYALTTMFNPMEGDNWSSQTDAQKALNYTGGRMKLLRNDGNWGDATDCGDYPSSGLSASVQNTNCTTNAIAAVNGTSGVEAWVLSTGQGIAYYLHGTAPSYTVTEITPASPTITASKSNVDMTATVGESATSTITVSGTSLEGDISLALSGTDASMFSISATSIAQATASGKITITYTPTLAGTHTATLTLSSTNAADVTIALSGTATEQLVVTGAELTQEWSVTTDILTAQTASRWASGWDGKIYVNDYANSVLYYYTSSGKTQVGASAAGTAIAHDDNGNIILGTTIWTAAANSWKILPAGSTTFQDLAVTLPDGMSSNYIQYIGHVAGNMMSSTGGALFLFPNTSTSVAKIIIKNGAQSSASEIPVAAITADAQSFAVPLTANPSSDAIAARVRAGNHFYYHNGTEFVAYPDNGINKTQGGTFFTLNETLYSAQPIGTNYLDGFQVVDIAANKVVATHTTQLTTPAYSPNANCITAEVVGDYEAKLYQYVPGQLAAQYSFKLKTSTGIEDVTVNSGEEFGAVVYGSELQILGVETATINLYNVSGIIVASASDAQSLDISDITAGIYVVQVKDVAGNTHAATITIK